MIYVVDVFFNNVPPSPEEILVQLEKHTGVQGFKLIISSGEFAHPYFEKTKYFVSYDKNRIKISTFSDSQAYLIDALIATLISMGGEAEPLYQLPEWASKKWDEVKHLFENQ